MAWNFFKQCVAVYVLLEQEDKILLMKRHNTGYMDGYWCVPSGKVDADEDLLSAAIREAGEEAGVEIAPQDLTLCHLVHHYDPLQKDNGYWVDVYFKASSWTGIPRNTEPHKAECVEWRTLSSIAEAGEFLIPRIDVALKGIQAGTLYTADGWENNAILNAANAST